MGLSSSFSEKGVPGEVSSFTPKGFWYVLSILHKSFDGDFNIYVLHMSGFCFYKNNCNSQQANNKLKEDFDGNQQHTILSKLILCALKVQTPDT